MKALFALLAALLAMILAAAPGGVLGDDKPMTSYFQSFSAPFDARVPPVYPASTINDEFRQPYPVIDAPGTVKFVQLDPKWDTFLPGGLGTLAAQVDPTRQMLQLSGTAPKSWAGVMQDLPLPALTDEFGIGYNLVTRLLPGWNLSNTNWGPAYWGLLLGDTMRTAPDTSQLWAIACKMQLDIANELTGSAIAFEQLDYSGPIVPQGSSAILPYQYFMAEVFSVQTAPNVFESQISFGVSLDGIFFQRLFQFSDLDVPLRQFALAFQTDPSDPGMGVFGDFVRYYPIIPGDSVASGPFNGNILQNGSV
jgi:hypothetical protein